ncbi:hypothetical protein RN001_000884 [Aquatica leii]|uniref:Nuclease HARBI1 n=1 Tax=Aquatica leii TaxID=1421715 RepID=A0AAN7QMA3_9COLE|nr:hypothetical protein RN001_000884 [Aquatica leii]
MINMSDETIPLAALALCITEKKNKKKHKKRTWWCKNWLLKRHTYSYVYLLEKLRLYPEDWRNYLPMDESTYVELLSTITPIIQKQNTVMRSSITPHERLSATLRYLATGRSYKDLKFSTVISPQTLSRIIPKTGAAIYII